MRFKQITRALIIATAIGSLSPTGAKGADQLLRFTGTQAYDTYVEIVVFLPPPSLPLVVAPGSELPISAPDLAVLEIEINSTLGLDSPTRLFAQLNLATVIYILQVMAGLREAQ